MPATSQGKILRAYFGEGDRYRDRPLHEAMLAKCREMKIAGATVFRGLEGFGETAEIHRHHLTAHDQPLVLVAVDSAANIQLLAPAIGEMMATGVIAVSDADIIRCQKSELA